VASYDRSCIGLAATSVVGRWSRSMPKHILVFHDSEESRTLIKYILTHEGYEVLTESFGNDEVPQIITVMPDLVMLDCPIDEPSTGWEIMLRLKSNPETSSVPIIFCISAKNMEDVKPYLGAKRIVLLVKPYDVNDLLLTIKEAFKLSDET
jgi:CheY-like chemotaxis protein